MVKKSIYLYLLPLSLLLASCVYPFTVDVGENQQSILSVEGSILIGEESEFYFTRTIALDSDESAVIYETVDEIWVEDDAGERYLFTQLHEGSGIYRYVLDGTSMAIERQYRLCFIYEGELFYSTFEKVLVTPEIESITYEAIQEDRLRVNISSHGVENCYFKWRYEEVWEDRAIYPFVGVFDDTLSRFVDSPYAEDEDPRYICWKYDSSYEIIIGDPSSYSGYYVSNRNIKDIIYTDRRISKLYCIEVFQQLISKDEYMYWSNIKKNSEETGGIFSQLPSELKGNITCANLSEESVLGYVGVSTITTKRKFIAAEEISLYRREGLCPQYELSKDPEMDILSWYRSLWSSGFAPVGVNWVKIECTDCRLTGGTKNRPDYWPINYDK